MKILLGSFSIVSEFSRVAPVVADIVGSEKDRADSPRNAAASSKHLTIEM